MFAVLKFVRLMHADHWFITRAVAAAYVSLPVVVVPPPPPFERSETSVLSQSLMESICVWLKVRP